MFRSTTIAVVAGLLVSSALAQSSSVTLYTWGNPTELGTSQGNEGNCVSLDGAFGVLNSQKTAIQLTVPQEDDCVTFYADDYCSQSGTSLPPGQILTLPGNAPILSFSVDDCAPLNPPGSERRSTAALQARCSDGWWNGQECCSSGTNERRQGSSCSTGSGQE